MDIEKIKIIADTYGYEPQSRQLIEEMAECTQAINKFWRKDYECDYRKNLIEELADVSIMLQQIIYLLNAENDVEDTVSEKINRQLKRIKNKKFSVDSLNILESKDAKQYIFGKEEN